MPSVDCTNSANDGSILRSPLGKVSPPRISTSTLAVTGGGYADMAVVERQSGCWGEQLGRVESDLYTGWLCSLLWRN